MRYIDFSSVKETIGKIYFGICICVFAYAVIGVPILLGMLKKHGVKTEAVITPRYFVLAPSLYYELLSV